MNNVCDFVGKITIKKIEAIRSKDFSGIQVYEDLSIKYQGLLTAEYIFFENKNQFHSGVLSGTVQSLFYIDANDSIQYNNLAKGFDGYFNNAFVDKWNMYDSDLEKICN